MLRRHALTRLVIWPRAPIATLIMLALLPNLTVAALVWLPAVHQGADGQIGRSRKHPWG
jgi:hypothetical protein